MIWNPNKECMSRDEMSALQGKRLNKIVTYVYHNVPFYRHKLQELDIRPDDIQTIEDIKRLPFTTKQDLRDNYPFGLQAAPRIRRKTARTAAHNPHCLPAHKAPTLMRKAPHRATQATDRSHRRKQDP